MLVQKIMTFLEKNGICTVDQIVKAVEIDSDTIDFIMQKLIKSNTVKHITPSEPCCKNRKSCNACSLVNIEYYYL